MSHVHRPSLRHSVLILATALFTAGPIVAQQVAPYRPTALTAAAYARAERHLAANMGPLVLGGTVRRTWLEGDRFWYRNSVAGGSEFVLVDPARKSRARAFDHEAVARGLAAATGEEVQPDALPFDAFVFVTGGIRVEASGKTFVCDPAAGRCTEDPADEGPGRSHVPSPDGTRAGFIRDFNL